MAYYDENGNLVGSGGGISAPASTSLSGDSGFLSGLGSLFAGLGSGIASGLKAANTPSAPSYSPYYTSTGINTSVRPSGLASLLNSPIVLIVLAVGAYLLFKRKG